MENSEIMRIKHEKKKEWVASQPCQKVFLYKELVERRKTFEPWIKKYLKEEHGVDYRCEEELDPGKCFERFSNL